MKKKYTVLLLSAPIGSGHKLAAEALEQVFSQQPDINVIHGNVFDFFPKFIGNTFLSCYLKILELCPWLYELAYKWGNRENGSLWLRTILNRVLARLAKSYLEEVKPDAVVATHATPAGIISIYKEQHPDLWLGAVVTDFTVHRWWLVDGVNTYFIGSELLRKKIKCDAEILAYGIPVRQQYLHLDKSKCRDAFGWDDEQQVCLLMGGGEGLLPMEEIVEQLQLKMPQLRLLAITGRNEKLAQRLVERYGSSLEVYGFREDVPQLMAAADMIITKAGGLTAAEVMVSDLQFLIYKPLPGQEAGNAAFLHRHCHAYVAHNLEQLVDGVINMSRDSSVPHQFYGRPNAAEDICAYVMKKLPSK